MTNEEKGAINDTAELYFNLFLSFYKKTKDTEQAYRLTHDMFGVMMKSSRNDNSLSIFWDRGEE